MRAAVPIGLTENNIASLDRALASDVPRQGEAENASMFTRYCHTRRDRFLAWKSIL